MSDQENAKGFNDDELKDIMDEIENLENELDDDANTGSDASVVDLRAESLKKKTKKSVSSDEDVSFTCRVKGHLVEVFLKESSSELTVQVDGGLKVNIPLKKAS